MPEEMTTAAVIADFRTTDYVSFIDYLNDWYYEDEDEESNN